jgi:hypothetical protein
MSEIRLFRTLPQIHTVTVRQAPWSLHHSTEGMSVVACSCGWVSPPIAETFVPDEKARHENE